MNRTAIVWRYYSWFQNPMEAISGPSIGVKIEKGIRSTIRIYKNIFLELSLKLDKEIKPNERF